MARKVYISELDSPLGRHLVEFFRDDHLDLNNFTLIVGTASKEAKMSGVYQTIDFSKQAQIACRAVLDCDVVILNLKSSSHEAQTIIRFLDIMHESVSKPIRVIGLSTMMTWEGTRGFETEKDMGDREKYISNILDENCWKRVEFKDQDYEKRISNNLFMKVYELENMLMKLNKNKNIKSSVLCSGLIYGKDNFEIQAQILKALKWESLTLTGNGNNNVPMVHIDTLKESLGILIEKTDLPYAIAVDKNILTQNQIKTLLNRAALNKKPLKIKDPHYLTKEDSLWNFSQVLIPSSIFSTVDNQNFAQYAANDILKDFYEYNQYSPKQFFVQIDSFDELVLQQLTETLSQYVYIIDQQEIDRLNQQMISKVAPPEPEVFRKTAKNAPIKPSSSQQERQPQFFYKQILEKLLIPRKCLNYALIINKKVKSALSKQYCYHQLVEIIQNQEQDHFQSDYKQIPYKSAEFYGLFGLEIQDEKSEQNLIKSRQQQSPVKDTYIPEKNLKKDEKLMLMNQYLLDNVLGPISQAKFNMRLSKKEQTLKNFIAELKAIYNRGNYKSSVLAQNKPTNK